MEEEDSLADSDEGESRKRSADDASTAGGGGGGASSSKRRRRDASTSSSSEAAEAAALRLPLELGWKRETLIRSVSEAGVRGDVTYTSPSGRRFRQYADVVRHLERSASDCNSSFFRTHLT